MWVDRKEAGKELAKQLYDYRNKGDTVVYGLTRGGVDVAVEVASQLQLPLDIIVVRKIGAPDNSEQAIGAVTADGDLIIDKDIVRILAIDPEYIKSMQHKEQQEAQRRLRIYQKAIAPRNEKVTTAILVDDGIATGSTMRAAIKDIKKKGAYNIIVAVPVLPVENVASLSKMGVKVLYLKAPDTPFFGVGAFYVSFPQLTDEQVVEILKNYTLRK